MKICVQSAGFAPEHGYCWLSINEDSQNQVDAPILVEKFSHLIQSEVPSVVIARNSGELLLLVTGLKAGERTDFRGRKIRNSVSWVCKNSDEKFLRKIAIRTLRSFLGRDSLQEDIDKAVKADNKNGVEVSFEAINQLQLEDNITDDAPEEKRRIAPNSPQEVDELINALEQYKLPNGDGLLVVYTGIKAESALDEAVIWWGLSSLVEKGKWKESLKKKFSSQNSVTEEAQSEPVNGILILFIILISLVAVGVLIYLLTYQPKQQEGEPLGSKPQEKLELVRQSDRPVTIPNTNVHVNSPANMQVQ